MSQREELGGKAGAVPDSDRELSFEEALGELQAIVQQLSVFRGGFSRMAAQEVAAANLRQLSRLVNKSLLQFDLIGFQQTHSGRIGRAQ